MLQVYVLSVLCPALCGWLLYKDRDDTGIEDLFKIPGTDTTLRFVAGVAGAVTGVLTLLSPVEGDVMLVGDLAPALASLTGGLALLEDHFYQKDGNPFRPHAFELLQKHRKSAGLAFMIISAVHFLLPKALFL